MKEKEKTKPEEEKAGALPPETGEKAAGAGQQDMSHETERSEACEKRLSWEEILADPEYRQAFDTQVQTIVQRRLRNRQSAEASLERLAPVFAALGERYGMENSEPDAIDALALAAQILGQDGEEEDGAAHRPRLHRRSLPQWRATSGTSPVSSSSGCTGQRAVVFISLLHSLG